MHMIIYSFIVVSYIASIKTCTPLNIISHLPDGHLTDQTRQATTTGLSSHHSTHHLDFQEVWNTGIGPGGCNRQAPGPWMQNTPASAVCTCHPLVLQPNNDGTHHSLARHYKLPCHKTFHPPNISHRGSNDKYVPRAGLMHGAACQGTKHVKLKCPTTLRGDALWITIVVGWMLLHIFRASCT